MVWTEMFLIVEWEGKPRYPVKEHNNITTTYNSLYPIMSIILNLIMMNEYTNEDNYII